MSSVFGAIKAFADSETRGLLSGKSFREKLKIGSALAAIDNNNKKQVLDLTRHILHYDPCHQGVDEIIKEIAFLNGYFKFSSDEWNNFLRSSVENVARGLTCGKEMAQVYHAVAALPKEKWPIIAKAKNLFKSYMSVEDRFILLSAIQSAETELDVELAAGLSVGNASIQDHISLLHAIAALPAGTKDDICGQCRRLRNGNQSIQDKIAILNAIAALPAGAMKDICIECQRLTNGNPSIQDKIAMLNAIAALPADAIEGICAECHLLTNGNTSIQDKIAMLNAIAALPADGRDDICRQCRRLTNTNTSIQDTIAILNAIVS